MTGLDPAHLRAYASRPWAEIENSKRAALAAQAATMTQLERLTRADELRRHARLLRPDTPDPQSRMEDLANHQRLAELLRAVVCTS